MGEVTFRVPNSLMSATTQETKSAISKDDEMYNDFANIKHRIRYRGYAEMCDFVKNKIFSILTSAVDKKPKALQILTDIDFLKALKLCELNLPKEYVNRFNRVYRAYVSNPSSNVLYNEECADIMGDLVKAYNARMIGILMTIDGMKPNVALWLVVNRYSSTDERRNIRRMTRAMQHMDPDFMTTDMIIKIFSKTDSDHVTNLFCAIMTDKFDNFDSDDESFVYSSVSDAVLKILESMDYEDVESIIATYEDELVANGTSGRFSLKAIASGDYPTICEAVDNLESTGTPIV